MISATHKHKSYYEVIQILAIDYDNNAVELMSGL
jgi:hypothetical protein